ncbi:MAG: hypothetical protein LBT99_00450, partial [Bifidobacteriaceae bacterium]|nr:hypothetical protein [Bifidobacteriaceae bacterium]
MQLVGHSLNFSIPKSQTDNATEKGAIILYLNDFPTFSFPVQNAKICDMSTFDRYDYSVDLPIDFVKSLYGWANVKLTNNNKTWILQEKLEFDK